MKISLLIVERGSQWLEHIKRWRKPANDLLVVTQHRSEPNREFRARVLDRLERLRQRRAAVDQVMVVAGGAQDPMTLLSRAQMLGAMLSRLSAEVHIVLNCDARSGDPAQRQMKALADTVVEQAGHPAGRIRLLADCFALGVADAALGLSDAALALT